MNEKDEYYYRLNLIHVTAVENANKIIQSQEFHVGGGLFGRGIYFGNTLEACHKKIKHHLRKNPHATIHWTYLIADVYVGKAKPISKIYAKKHSINTALLARYQYTAVIGHGLRSGREFIVFSPNQVHNIKYIDGYRPSVFTRINRIRIVLFYTTSVSEASEISRAQEIPMKDGPFGRAIHLFYTIEDARKFNHNRNSETVFACEVRLESFHKIEGRERLTSRHIISQGFRSFSGYHNQIKVYMFKDPSLVFNIHYCGGRYWHKGN